MPCAPGEWKWQINAFIKIVLTSWSHERAPRHPQGSPFQDGSSAQSTSQIFWYQNQCGSQLTVSIWEDVHRPQANGTGHKIQLLVKGGRETLHPKPTQTLWDRNSGLGHTGQTLLLCCMGRSSVVTTIVPGVHPFLWVDSRQLFFLIVFLVFLFIFLEESQFKGDKRFT